MEKEVEFKIGDAFTEEKFNIIKDNIGVKESSETIITLNNNIVFKKNHFNLYSVYKKLEYFEDIDLYEQDEISKDKFFELLDLFGGSLVSGDSWNWVEYKLKTGYIFNTDKDTQLVFRLIRKETPDTSNGGFLYSRDKKKSPNYYKTFKK